MAQKPKVIYIENKSDGLRSTENCARNALSYYLGEHCGCEVLMYDHEYYFNEELDKLVKLAQFGLVILVIVRQEKYSDQHTAVIKLVRERMPAGMPIVVIPEGWGDERFTGQPDDPLVHSYDHFDSKLVTLVKRLVRKWKPPVDWLLGGVCRTIKDYC